MNKFRIDGVIGWDVMASDIAAFLDGAGDVEIVINSGGGDILEGFSIFNALQDHEGEIKMHVDFAGSMASVIAMAGDTVTMRERSSLMMIHKPWSGAIGDANDMRQVAESLDKMETMLSDIYLRKAGDALDESGLAAMLEAETWLTAQEAKTYGLADKVVGGDGESKMNFGHVAMDINKLAAKVAKQRPIKGEISQADSLAKIEGVLRDSACLSKSDATALVSRIKDVSRGDRGEESEASALLNKLNSFTAKLESKND